MVYLEKLRLVSVMVVEVDNVRDTQDDRTAIIEARRFVLGATRFRARPVLGAVARLGPGPHESEDKHLQRLTPFPLISRQSTLRSARERSLSFPHLLLTRCADLFASTRMTRRSRAVWRL
ncbi:hypothetical protein BDZ89DRAFT_794028 [Hymenopellis radicata]|nr:hypothetical protein BDZ89DRAFT_794028 [Hymenopellis radicata]